MKKTSVDLGVGIFVLIGLMCVGYLTIRLGKMEVFKDEYYILNARFQSGRLPMYERQYVLNQRQIVRGCSKKRTLRYLKPFR